MLVMVQDDVATCKSCGESKPLSEFDKNNKSTCKDCRRAYSRNWQSNNKDRVRANVHKRRELITADPKLLGKDRAASRDKMRRFRENNPDYVKRNRAQALAWNKANPERARANDKRYKERNRDTYNAYYSGRAADKRNTINAIKAKPCHDCGQSFPPHVMDFDHVRGKKRFGVAKMQNHGLEAILAEIAKCDLVCANCHRIRTYNRHHGLDKKPAFEVA